MEVFGIVGRTAEGQARGPGGGAEQEGAAVQAGVGHGATIGPMAGFLRHFGLLGPPGSSGPTGPGPGPGPGPADRDFQYDPYRI